jgi:hypothetical protein
MDKLKSLLNKLKDEGAVGIKISFEDEGALLNEMITMRYLTAFIGLELSIKIGGCEAKRDIVDCINLCCDSIVSPMIESKFALEKFINSIEKYEYMGKKGFNLETINAYNNLNELENVFNYINFVTVGRIDFVGSLNKNRDSVNSDDIYKIVEDIFYKVKKYNKKCYLGGGINIDTKEFIEKLKKNNLIDYYETRYVIFDINKVKDYKYSLYLANIFEIEWMKYIRSQYLNHADKDKNRITMIENRIKNIDNNNI